METKPYGIIYLIQNKVNGKMYVGQTTQTFEKRMYGHIHISRTKPKCLIDIKLKEYGLHNFESFIIDRCYTNQEDLDILECFYIKKFNSKVDNECGYNIREGGRRSKLCEIGKQKLRGARPQISGSKNPNFGNKYSKETREKISNNHADVSGVNNPMYGMKGKNNPNSKAVMCINNNKVYDCVYLCAEDLKLNYNSVVSAANGNRKSVFGYFFKYL